jgi:hypothetical protein
MGALQPRWLEQTKTSVVIVKRSTQPHVHMYMLCPYVISTLYHLLEESQMRTFKRYISDALFSQLYT